MGRRPHAAHAPGEFRRRVVTRGHLDGALHELHAGRSTRFVRSIAIGCCRSARFSRTSSRCPRSPSDSARPATSLLRHLPRNRNCSQEGRICRVDLPLRLQLSANRCQALRYRIRALGQALSLVPRACAGAFNSQRGLVWRANPRGARACCQERASSWAWLPFVKLLHFRNLLYFRKRYP